MNRMNRMAEFTIYDMLGKGEEDAIAGLALAIVPKIGILVV